MERSDILAQLLDKMGSHWKNFYVDNHVHHVTCTVHKWQKALLFPGILEPLYDEINKHIGKWQIFVLDYVIMPEHFHSLLFSNKGENILKAIQGIRSAISSHARYVNELEETASVLIAIKTILIKSCFTKALVASQSLDSGRKSQGYSQ